jgi:hypothetical protein
VYIQVVVATPSLDELREQLRARGYLSHGIDRWFGLDPRSKSFWSELLRLALRTAVLLAPLFAAPMLAVMLWKNRPVAPADLGGMLLLYLAGTFTAALALIILAVLLLKIRVEVGVRRPAILTAVAAAVAALATGGVLLWWSGFELPPERFELLLGAPLLLLAALAAIRVVETALLSFAIHEARRLPEHMLQAKTRWTIAAGALLLTLALALPLLTAGGRADLIPPEQIVKTPHEGRLAFIAVDGLTRELFESRPELAARFRFATSARTGPPTSPAERWITIGTGTLERHHGVHSLHAVRLRGSGEILQSTSRFDPFLALAGRARLITHEPLAPAGRQRHYLWEIFAGRGVTSLAVNWWASEDRSGAGLAAQSQETIFAAAAGASSSPADLANQLEQTAIERFTAALTELEPDFATIYLPALDILNHRIDVEPTVRLAHSVEALTRLQQLLRSVRADGYEVIVLGLPGRGGRGEAVVASSLPLRSELELVDLAPTLADFFGFPASEEMPGRSAFPDSNQTRISTFGSRSERAAPSPLSREYYENLRSLGYIR